MNCNKCGFLLTENDQNCKSCGSPANVINAQNKNLENVLNNFVEQTIPNENNIKFVGPINNEMNSSFTTPINNAVTNKTGVSMENEIIHQFTGQAGNEMMTNFIPPINNIEAQGMKEPIYNNQTVKKGNKTTLFIIIAIVVIAAVLGVIFGMKFLENDSNDNQNNNGIVNKPEIKLTYKVNYNGFTFKVPTDLVYHQESNAIHLSDEDGTWIAVIQVIEGAFASLVNNKNNIEQTLQEQGLIVNTAEEKNISEMEFITIEVSQSEQNALLAYTKANSMYIFAVTAYNLDNEFNYDLLTPLAEILNSAEYTGENNNTNLNIDMNSINELIK